MAEAAKKPGRPKGSNQDSTSGRCRSQAQAWKLPCDLTEDEHHEQMKAILTVVCTATQRTRNILTLSQAAAKQGLSVEELRDDAALWKDTDIRLRRIATRLKAKLHDRVMNKDRNKSLAAIAMLESEFKERQLSSSNRVVLEGSGAKLEVVMFVGEGVKDTEDSDDDQEQAGSDTPA